MFDIEHLKLGGDVCYVSIIKVGNYERHVETDRILVERHGWTRHRRNINDALTEMGLPILPEDGWVPENHVRLPPA